MVMREFHCEKCGGNRLEKGADAFFTCQNCGARYREDTLQEQRAALSALLDEQKQESVANCRQNLWQAAHEEIVSSTKILACCRALKQLLPDDFLANFYETANSGNDFAVNAFLNAIDAVKYAAFLDDVVEFSIKSLESRNVGALKSLITRAYRGEKYTQYMTRVEDEAEKLDEGMYNANIPRDVFVAYSSADMAQVNEFVAYLEEQGISCFVALRNLRHGRGAAENYESLLKTAMHRCKCVLFLSSEHSRRLACDALKIELPHILDNEPQMGRIEYLLEEYGGETKPAAKTILEEFFKGLEYCRTKEDAVRRITKYITGSGKPKHETKICVACGTENQYSSKFCRECGGSEFVDTIKEYAEAKERLLRKKLEEEYRGKSGREEEPEEKGGETPAPTGEENVADKAEEPQAESSPEKGPSEQEEKATAESKAKEAETAQEPVPEPAPAPAPAATPAPASSSDFEIENGVLKKYAGSDVHVAIPEGVTKVGDFAFDWRSDVLSVKFPSSLTAIGDNAFYQCSGLTALEIPESVTAIGYCAFHGCSELKTVAMPKALEGKIDRIFQKEKDHIEFSFGGVSETPVHESAEAAPEHAPAPAAAPVPVSDFEIEGTVLKKYVGIGGEVVIPSGVTAIEKSAFRGNDAITGVVIPSEVKEIGASAFEDCSNIGKLVISHGVQTIKFNTFENCVSLTRVELPSSVTSIGDSAFDGCSGLTDVVLSEGVKTIGDFAFNACGKLTSIVIPRGVTRIGGWAFQECGELTGIELPESMKDIGENAFSGCSKLKRVTMPKALEGQIAAVFDGEEKHITFTFSGTSSAPAPQTHASVPEPAPVSSSDFEIENGVLKKYKGSDETVAIPNGVKEIDALAFDHCSDIKSVSFPASLTSIGNWAFSSCSGLTELAIPSSVTSIGYGAFQGCSGLKKVTMPRALEGKTDRIFQEEKEHITFHYGEVSAPAPAAAPVRKTAASVPAPAPVSSSDFEIENGVLKKYKGSDETVAIPNGVKEIDALAFDHCSDIKSVSFPASLTSIGNWAFSSCSGLTELAIPSSVTSIGYGAFQGCSGLKKVTMPRALEGKTDRIFQEEKEHITFHYGEVSARKTAPAPGPKKPTPAPSPSPAPTPAPAPKKTVSSSDFVIENGVLVKYTGKGGAVMIPSGVVTIGGQAFNNCEGVRSIKIPNTVTTIENSAFWGCKKLDSVFIPESVTTVGFWIFSDCKKVEVSCAAKKKPGGWHKDWNVINFRDGLFAKRCKVNWGAKK